MFGHDLWNAYEVSFLLPSGKPAVYHMQATYAADTPNIVESKSFKLYLNSWNDKTVADLEAFRAAVGADLAACIGGPVTLYFHGPESSPPPRSAPGFCLDGLTPNTIAKATDAGLLALRAMAVIFVPLPSVAFQLSGDQPAGLGKRLGTRHGQAHARSGRTVELHPLLPQESGLP